jgi:glycosyltransferase involved in cell wall biosynthesis
MPRWFAAIPLPPREHEDVTFWARDCALWCRGFELVGVESKVVALGELCQRQDRPLILAPLQQMGEPAWWKQWHLDGVVLYSWALRQYEPIAQAIKQAGAKLVLYLDTGGIVSPHVWPWMYWRTVAITEQGRGRWFPRAVALLRTLAASLPQRHVARLRHLELADLVAVPTPMAKQRYSRYLLAVHRPDLLARLCCIPSLIEDKMTYDAQVPKKPVITAVGGWHRVVKNPQRLVQVLGRVLSRQPSYSARVIGPGAERIQQEIRKLKGAGADRIQVLGPVPPDKVRLYYQDSQISLCSSFSESFHMASAEALCCGCSVVGDVRIASMPFFTSYASGTVACNLSLGAMSDAVLAEVEAWQAGERDPVQISRYWTAKLHPQHAARKLLACLGSQIETTKIGTPLPGGRVA